MLNSLKRLRTFTKVFFVFISSSLVVNASQEIDNTDEFGLTIPTVYENYRLRAKVEEELVPLSHNFSGELIDYYSGNLTLSVTDISIPGNFNIPVSFSRQIRSNSIQAGSSNSDYGKSLGDWSAAIPSIEARVGKAEHMFCGMDKPPAVKDDIFNRYSFIWDDFFNGLSLNLGNGDAITLNKVFDSAPEFVKQGATYYTKNKWLISCEGQFFIASSPQGLTYRFTNKKDVGGNDASKTVNMAGGNSEEVSVSTRIVKFQVTKISDIHGNYVDYQYNDFNFLTNINASDGRSLTISYDDPSNAFSPKIKSITAGNRIWSYQYSNNSLNKVIRPDGKYWQYSLDGLTRLKMPYNSDVTSAPHPQPKTFNVTHPDGANVEYQFTIGFLHRLGYEYAAFQYCWKWNDDASEVIPCENPTSNKTCRNINCKSRMPAGALTRKKITYGQREYTWLFDIENFNEKLPNLYLGDFPEFTPNPNKYTQAVTITSPNQIEVQKYHRYKSELEGKLISTEIFDLNGNKLKSSVTEIALTQDYYAHPLCVNNIGEPRARNSDINCDNLAKLEQNKKITASLYSNGAQTQYITQYQQYNQYGTPEKWFETQGSLTRYYKKTYLHDTDKWLLNLPTKQYVSNTSDFGTPYQETTYNSSLLPYQQKSMGRLVSTNIYHADGNLKKTTYNGSNRYEQFDDYYRGKAQKITMPCATTNGCSTANGSTANTVIAKLEVNSDGTTKSVTDFNGHKTSYSYNPIGWLTKIDYANGDWSDKIISYVKVSTANDGITGSGIAVGQLKQTITQGNFEQKIYHDGLLRPTFMRTRDKINSDTISYQRTEYDHENRPTLQSFPSSNASATTGTVTTYDALGRVIGTLRQSDNAASSIEYLSGNKQRVTDAKGNVTTTTYLAYGSPSYDKPTLIDAPDSDNTAIVYNKFGQIKTIIQGEVTEKRLYDGYQQLCKTYRPETGVTAYGYNAQRQPIWRAEGTDGGHVSCAPSSVSASHKVILGYDNLGQLRTENFPDDTPDNTYSYDANGNLASLISGSGSSAISWSYLYNSLNLIDKETLSIDGKSFTLDWGYNSLGAVSSLKYPSGRTVDYSPNALGQPTKASEGAINYVSNVKYHPNGQLKQLTYGNGMLRIVALDTTGRIDAITDAKGSAYQLNLDPSYDLNDNIHSVIDWVDRSNDIDNMSYDGLDRLKSADGKWGTGNYTYDGLGNIKTRSISGSSITYHYNTLNRLDKLSGAYGYNYAYDTRGNVTHNGRYGLDFNRANQVTTAKGIPYRYDGHNRRVKKRDEYSVYSQAGQLLYRQKSDGSSEENIYIDKELIAVIDDKSI